MKGKSILAIVSMSALVLAPLSGAGAGELPPKGSKPLSEILKSTESKKLGRVTEAEFDDGLWKVKLCNGGACQKLYLDPKEGSEKRRRKTTDDEVPPTNAMPLSKIIEAVETSGRGTITEAEFDDGYWEIEFRKDSRKTEVFFNPVTGKER